MKEATGEGSMTIVTIVVIVALGAAAAVIVGFMLTRAGSKANDAAGTNVEEYSGDTLDTDDLFSKKNNNGGNGEG